MKKHLLFCWLLVAASSTAAAEERRDILLVFPIEARGLELSAQDLESLGDFLSSRLGEGKRFSIIPRESVRRQLDAQKAESYKSCYDTSCQIELGRELAAGFTVAAQINRIGSLCLVTASLYDLKKAATLDTASAKGDCRIDSLVAAIDKIAERLLGERTVPAQIEPQTPSPPISPTPPPPQTMASIQITSDPTGADVQVEGNLVARTPANMLLEEGRAYNVTVAKEGFAPAIRTIIPVSGATFEFKLRLSTESRRQRETDRNEWIGVDLLLGHDGKSAQFGILERFFVLKWKHFFWSILEGQVVGTIGGDSKFTTLFGGTRLGYPLYLGEQNQHQLRFGLGVGYCSRNGNDSQSGTSLNLGFCLMPVFNYIWQTGGWFHIGVGLRMLIPVVEKNDAPNIPLLFLLSVPMGWTQGI